jgi:hypothetical protein
MPKNEPGYAYCVLALLLSAMLNAIIFGDIATLVHNLTKEEQAIQDINDRNNTVMNEINLPGETKNTIREFF